MDIDRSKQGKPKCWNCGKEGHKSYECPTSTQRFNARSVEINYLRRVLAEREEDEKEKAAEETTAEENDEKDF